MRVASTYIELMSLEIIMGCMFSGKSTELIRRIHRFQSIGKRVCVINHTTDTRTDDAVQTHYGEKVSALKYVHLMNFIEVGHALTYDVICIDEAQFFGDLFSSVITISQKKALNIHLYSKLLIMGILILI